MGDFLRRSYLIVLAAVAALSAIFCAVKFNASDRKYKSSVNSGQGDNEYSSVISASVQVNTDVTETADITGNDTPVNSNAYELMEISTLSVPGYYSYSFTDTNINDYSYFSCLNIAVKPGEKYHIIASVYGRACLYKFIDSEGYVTAVFDPDRDDTKENESIQYDEIISVPANSDRMLVSYDNEKFSVLEKLQDSGSAGIIDTEDNTDDVHCAYSYAMSSTLCIGDSLTSGAYFKQPLPGNLEAGDSIFQCYPYYLKRMNNMDEVTNAGVSGITVNGWLASEYKKYDMTEYDSFIIWLGTNGGITGSLENDVIPYSSYSEYPNTGVGNYCTIIEKIRETNPDCFIVMCTVFDTVSGIDAATTNSNIYDIAERYSINVIDMSDLTFENYPELHGNYNNIHFSKSGNIFVASRIVDELNSIFSGNPSLTEFGISKRKIK